MQDIPGSDTTQTKVLLTPSSTRLGFALQGFDLQIMIVRVHVTETPALTT